MGDAAEFVRAAWTIGITVLVIFVVLIAVGFWLLSRRNSRWATAPARQDISRRANILLVRLDDAVATGEEELGFAIAQFGRSVTSDYTKALASARSSLTEAFGLKQRLDDAVPDSETERRDWTARIIQLCENTSAALRDEAKRFDQLRHLERNAPANLATLRSLIQSLGDRRAVSAPQLRILRERYAASAIASVTDNLARADAALASAGTGAVAGEAALGATSTTAAVDAIRSATDDAHLAGQLFDAIDSLATELDRATDAVDTLVASTRRSLDEARALRDAPPDATSSAAIGDAIEMVERVLAQPRNDDPFRALDEVRDAVADLDARLAGARNQQRRLDGARAALAGALAAARSQLAVTRDFISVRRGSVGAEARTRLAEAERLLTLAEAEADPLLALDTARSSASYSRDADALARYDMH